MIEAWYLAVAIVMFGVLIITQSWIAVVGAAVLAFLYGRRIRTIMRRASR